MRVKIRMRNRGCKHRPLWDLIVQPDKKKFEGKYLELVGKYMPRSVKTYKRGILINRPRFKYWLSVGATPTKQVQRIMHKYEEFLPKEPQPFGSRHRVEPRPKTYYTQWFKYKGKRAVNPSLMEYKAEILHRSEIQGQINLIERKKRLQWEAMQNLGNKDFNEVEGGLSDLQTSEIESEEANVLERKKNFDELAKRFEKNRRENRALSGNDYKYNLYLKKMTKLTRLDLGLDFESYKDYINNLHEFAKHKEFKDYMSSVAIENEEPTKYGLAQISTGNKEMPYDRLMELYKTLNDYLGLCDKLMVEKPVFVNQDDRALHKRFMENMPDMLRHPQLTHQIRRKFEQRRAQKINLAVPLHDYTLIPLEHVKKMGVNEKEFKLIKEMMDIDKKIFDPNLHLDSHTSVYKYLVDFSKYRDKEISKEVKKIFYRPHKMKHLFECYWKIAGENDQKRIKQKWDQYFDNKIYIVPIFLQQDKDAEDYVLMDQLVEQFDTLMDQNREQGREYQKLYESWVESGEIHDIQQKIDTMNLQNEGPIKQAIKYRDQLPDEERAALLRYDSVDEIDTDDVVNWSLFPNYQEYYKHFTDERLRRHRGKNSSHRPMEPYYSKNQYENIVADYTKGTDSEWDQSDQERVNNFKKYHGLPQSITESDTNTDTEELESEDIANKALEYIKKVETGQLTGNEALDPKNIFQLESSTSQSEDTEEVDKTQFKYRVRSIMRRMAREDPFRKVKDKSLTLSMNFTKTDADFVEKFKEYKNAMKDPAVKKDFKDFAEIYNEVKRNRVRYMDQQYLKDLLNYDKNEFEPQQDLSEKQKKLKDHLLKKEYQFVDSQGKIKYMFDPTEEMGVVPFRQRTDQHNVFADYQQVNGRAHGAILTPEDEQKKFEKMKAIMDQADKRLEQEIQEQLKNFDNEESDNALEWEDQEHDEAKISQDEAKISQDDAKISQDEKNSESDLSELSWEESENEVDPEILKLEQEIIDKIETVNQDIQAAVEGHIDFSGEDATQKLKEKDDKIASLKLKKFKLENDLEEVESSKYKGLENQSEYAMKKQIEHMLDDSKWSSNPMVMDPKVKHTQDQIDSYMYEHFKQSKDGRRRVYVFDSYEDLKKSGLIEKHQKIKMDAYKKAKFNYIDGSFATRKDLEDYLAQETPKERQEREKFEKTEFLINMKDHHNDEINELWLSMKYGLEKENDPYVEVEMLNKTRLDKLHELYDLFRKQYHKEGILNIKMSELHRDRLMGWSDEEYLNEDEIAKRREHIKTRKQREQQAAEEYEKSIKEPELKLQIDQEEVDKVGKALKDAGMYDQMTNPFENHFEDLTEMSSEEIPNPIEFHMFEEDEKRLEYDMNYLLRRHHLDYDKVFLQNKGGYSLRKYKKVYKRHMEDMELGLNPYNYMQDFMILKKRNKALRALRRKQEEKAAKMDEMRAKYNELYDECQRIYGSSQAVKVEHDEGTTALKQRYGLTDKDLGLDILDSAENNYKSKKADGKKGKQSYKKTMHAKKVQQQMTKDWDLDKLTMAQKLFHHISTNNPELIEFAENGELVLSQSELESLSDEQNEIVNDEEAKNEDDDDDDDDEEFYEKDVSRYEKKVKAFEEYCAEKDKLLLERQKEEEAYSDYDHDLANYPYDDRLKHVWHTERAETKYFRRLIEGYGSDDEDEEMYEKMEQHEKEFCDDMHQHKIEGRKHWGWRPHELQIYKYKHEYYKRHPSELHSQRLIDKMPSADPEDYEFTWEGLYEFWRQRDLTVGRYPQELREYENYEHYQLARPGSTLEDYTAKMNEPCSFQDYFFIQVSGFKQDTDNPIDQFETTVKDSEFYKTNVDHIVQSPEFYDNVLKQYQQTTKHFLMDKKIFKFVDAIEEVADLDNYGDNNNRVPLYNAYIPSPHTIMPRPDLYQEKDLMHRFSFGKTKISMFNTPVPNQWPEEYPEDHKKKEDIRERVGSNRTSMLDHRYGKSNLKNPQRKIHRKRVSDVMRHSSMMRYQSTGIMSQAELEREQEYLNSVNRSMLQRFTNLFTPVQQSHTFNVDNQFEYQNKDTSNLNGSLSYYMMSNLLPKSITNFFSK